MGTLKSLNKFVLTKQNQMLWIKIVLVLLWFLVGFRYDTKERKSFVIVL